MIQINNDTPLEVTLIETSRTLSSGFYQKGLLRFGKEAHRDLPFGPAIPTGMGIFTFTVQVTDESTEVLRRDVRSFEKTPTTIKITDQTGRRYLFGI